MALNPLALRSMFSSNDRIFTIFVWLLGLIAFIGLTVKDVVPLVDDYYNNNAATQTQVITRNKTVKPPSLTFCIPYWALSAERIMHYLLPNYTGDFPCDDSCKEAGAKALEDLATNFWDLRQENASVLFESAIQTKDTEVMLAFLFRKLLQHDRDQNTFEALDVRNVAWNQPLLDAVWGFFYCLGTYYKTGRNFTCMRAYPIDEVLVDKTKVDKLYEMIVSFLCAHTSIHEMMDVVLENNVGDDLCSKVLASASSHPFSDGFCFALPMGDNGTVVAVRSRSRYGDWGALLHAKLSFKLIAGTAMVTWPLGDTTQSDTLFISESVNEAITNGLEVVHLKYVVLSTVLGQKHSGLCYQESTPADCVGNCVLSKLIQCRQCVPFTFRKNPAASTFRNLPYCPSKMDNWTCDLDEMDDACAVQNCSFPCEYVSYQWHVTQEFVPDISFRAFALTVVPVASPYVQFNLTMKQTWEQFIGNVYAIFGLYLGVSGLTAVAIFVQCVGLLQKWRSKTTLDLRQRGSEVPMTSKGESDRAEDLKTLFEAKDAETTAKIEELRGIVRNLELKFDRVLKESACLNCK